MKFTKIVIFIFLISFTFDSYGQYKGKSSFIGISAGFEKSYLKDQAFSPLNFSNFNASYNVHFILQKKKYVIPVFVDFSIGNIHTSIDYFTSAFIKGNIDIGYLHHIFPKKAVSNKAVIYIGTGISSYIQYLDYLEQQSFSFFILHSADIKLSYQYTLSNRSYIEGYLSVPIVGLLVRPPYAGYDEELDESQSKPLRLLTNGDLVTLNNVFSFRNRILYRYSLSGKFSILCTYVFKYISVSTDFYKGYRNAENIILLGIDFKF